MREVDPMSKWEDEGGYVTATDSETGEPVGRVKVTRTPSNPDRQYEATLVMTALLMRLYDVNLALLAHFDEEAADRIFTQHHEGGNFNPPIYIPEFGDRDEKTD